jgi:hypothetical protein
MGMLHRTGDLWGTRVVDTGGLLVGVVADTWPLDGSGQPELALVRVGKRFPRLRYLPLESATLTNSVLCVPWTRHEIEDAPSAEDDRWGDPGRLALAYWTQTGE